MCFLPSRRFNNAGEGESPHGILSSVAVAAAVVLPLVFLFWHLHGSWNSDGAYAHGWAVPILATCLLRFRWADRPERSPTWPTARFVAAGLAAMALPALWLQEAAPERGVAQWSYAVATVGTSLALIALVGGASWLRWFGFPVAFALSSVPWPHLLEMGSTHLLMWRTAGITTEVLCCFGIPAVRTGNLVQIEPGVIDIDEGCGGIRSFQAMVMLSLFLGELFRLRPAARVILLLLGLGGTLLANVLRTSALASVAIHSGMGAVDGYHDFAGGAVLVFSLSIALWAAWLLRPQGGLALPLAAQQCPSETCASALPRWPFFGVICFWYCFAECGIEGWYRLHETYRHGWSWTIRWPVHHGGFKRARIPRRSLAVLRCDESQAAAWRNPDGSQWSLYLLRWNSGNVAAEPAKVHRPDICLNAEGAVQQADTGSIIVHVGQLRIPFHCYTFGLSGKTLYVFFCLCEEGWNSGSAKSLPQFEEVGMLERAIKGRRNLALQTVEVAVSGYSNPEEAKAAFNKQIVELTTQL